MSGEYIFRVPQDTPPLTFEGLAAYIGSGGERKIGTTVLVTLHPARDDCAASVTFRLYDTNLAVIDATGVYFTRHGDRHQATREWIAMIAVSNEIATSAWRPRSGVLCLDGNPQRPVEGHAYVRGSWGNQRADSHRTTG